MIKPIIAANWKMNQTSQDAESFFEQFTKDSVVNSGKVSTIVCPPATLLHIATKYAQTPNFYVGGQTLNEKEKGAFTGEISGRMLQDIGCKTVLVGHSERRHLYGESNALVAKKAFAAAHANLRPIFCVGETLVDRQDGKTFQVIRAQINALFGEAPFLAPFIVAYEPVWAIGTGQVATPKQAQEVHAFIRQLLAERLSEKGREIPLLYGGSVTPENAKELLSQADIDGALVGGASLQADSFLKIVHAAV
jgi:triosephosphate isomerase (TIM)